MVSGTHGRKWYTDEENNICFSLFIQMNCDVKEISNITYEISELIIKILKNIYGINLQIKLPNDIVYKNKKIGGILVQTKLINEIVEYMVVGIGINTNQKSFNNEIKDIATSIKNEFGINIDSKKVITEFCNLFENKIMKVRRI